MSLINPKRLTIKETELHEILYFCGLRQGPQIQINRKRICGLNLSLFLNYLNFQRSFRFRDVHFSFSFFNTLFSASRKFAFSLTLFNAFSSNYDQDVSDGKTSNKLDRSLFQALQLFFPKKVRLLIIVPERMFSRNHTSQTSATNRGIIMISSYLKKQFFSLEKLNK